ncbi:splicing factor 3b subunit [Anaeramoeba flamelloides]|uniref:Splicing factor 3b subunit n=1 Tax=Anaeramoeba flamelloides TaxID=1746091 RepID=A0AAV7ZFU5_9EUKA|nr:splicing factor 3b subunit [Anaeramoeba flamelloides]
MSFYHLTLQQPTSIFQSLKGHFLDPNESSLIVSKGRVITLYIISTSSQTNSLLECSTVDVFGFIRSMCVVSLPNSELDCVAITTDSGYFSLIEFNFEKQTLDCIFQERISERGLKRTELGHTVVCKNNLLLMTAIESKMMVCNILETTDLKLYLSNHAILLNSQVLYVDTCWVDFNQFPQTIASLQMNCKKELSGKTFLVFYQYNPSTQQLAQLEKFSVDPTSNLLIPVPSGNSSLPGGILICSKQKITYMNNFNDKVEINLPIREGELNSTTNKSLNINCGVFCYAETDPNELNSITLYFLIQNDLGDLFKLGIKTNDRLFTSFSIGYFDTIPVSTELCYLEKNYLFSPSNSESHIFYEINSWEISNINEKTFKPASDHKHLTCVDEIGNVSPLLFSQIIQNNDNNNKNEKEEEKKINQNKNKNENEKQKENKYEYEYEYEKTTTKLYCLSGTSQDSSFQILRHGLPISEILKYELTSENQPNNLWTIKSEIASKHHEYIIISYENETEIFKIKDDNLFHVDDFNLFEPTVKTLECKLMYDNSIIQIYPEGIRHLKSNGEIINWTTSGQEVIEQCTANSLQVVIYLSGGSLVYFELTENGNLPEKEKIDFEEICSMDICDNVNFNYVDNNSDENQNFSQMNFNKLKSQFLVVGGWANTLQILSLSEGSILHTLCSLDIKSKPESLALIEMKNSEYNLPKNNNFSTATSSNSSSSSSITTTTNTTMTTTTTKSSSLSSPQPSSSSTTSSSLFLIVGLDNGILIRYIVDQVNGNLNDPRIRFLSKNKPIKLKKTKIMGQNSIIALTDLIWLLYNWNRKLLITPLCSENFDQISYFNQELIPEAFISLYENQLKIFTIEKLGKNFSEELIQLTTTPRKMVTHPENGIVFLILRDFLKNNLVDKDIDNDENKLKEIQNKEIKIEMEVEMEVEMEKEKEKENEKDENENENENERMKKKSLKDNWISGLAILDPNEFNVNFQEFTEKEEVGFSLCILKKDSELFLIVGSAVSVTLLPRKCKFGYITVYKIMSNKPLQLITKIKVENIPYCLCANGNSLIAGIGPILRIYEFDNEKLLRKSEYSKKNNLSFIVSLSIKKKKNLIFVGDISKSIFIFKYSNQTQQLTLFAKENIPRFVNTHYQDDHVLFVGDKFGNLFVNKINSYKKEEINEKVLSLSSPTKTENELERNQNKNKNIDILQQNKLLDFENIAHFHIGEIICSIEKVLLGASSFIFYSTILGTFGALLPFVSNEDISFFSNLQMLLRKKIPTISGNDHLAWRSYYFPSKGVIDGDFCELFCSLHLETQTKIASKLKISVSEILRRIEDLRNRIL